MKKPIAECSEEKIQSLTEDAQVTRCVSSTSSCESFESALLPKENDESIDVQNETINDDNKHDESDVMNTTISSQSFKDSLKLDKSINNQELMNSFATNMHRIDKDVARCDRHYYYFSNTKNLEKLRNIMYRYAFKPHSIF